MKMVLVTKIFILAKNENSDTKNTIYEIEKKKKKKKLKVLLRI